MARRYIAQRAVSGDFLHWDVPLRADESSWDLSGPGALTATVSPDVGQLRADDGRLLLEEWGTYLYAEDDGEIRWGGIVISSKFSGEEWQIEAAGFSTYPHGIPFVGELSEVSFDPALAIRAIWDHVQSFPDGDLAVEVVGNVTPVRLGTPATTRVNDEGETEPVEADPYELAWWNSTDCGGEIDDLIKTTPLDYTERHYWDGEEIRHEIRLHYPRAGRRRDDLAFVQGVNISNVVAPEIDGDEFANEVLGVGAGEGKASVNRTISERDGRLRRPHVYTDKSVSSNQRMDALIREEIQRRRIALRITSVDVTQHPNARIGSWSLGDDVLIDAVLPWLGRVQVWCRVVGWTSTGPDTATLLLARSDSFRYGGTT